MHYHGCVNETISEVLAIMVLLLHLLLTDVRKRSYLSEQLKQQLKDQRMIFSKSELQLTSIVGQGDVFDQLSGIALSPKLLFQGSREWCIRGI